MKLITINIEGVKHLETVIPFISTELPDVLCLQEVCDFDIVKFETLGYTMQFVPATMRGTPKVHEEGIALGIRNKTCLMHSTRTYYLIDQSGSICKYSKSIPDYGFNNPCLMADISCDSGTFRIGTTHFVWTPHGPTPTDSQRHAMDTLFGYMHHEGSHVLCGDFNIPRNLNPLYDILIKKYTDTIPEKYHSSLDANLHRFGHSSDFRELFTSYMVDYILTKPPFVATDVRLVSGISDHMAVVATISTH